MMYVDPFHTQVAVSEETWPASKGYVHQRIIAEMVGYAHEHGFPMFDTEAIKITVRPAGEYEMTRGLVLVRGSWHPRDDWPVEFLDGPLDGELRVLEPYYLRQGTIVLPVLVPAAERFTPEAFYPSVTQAVEYRRAGINPETNQWVYVWRR